MIDAEIIIDDIIDSGETRRRYARFEKPFFALVDKTGDDKNIGWVKFPWEQVDPLKDNEDTVIRQLELIGEDPKREGLVETPRRYLKAMKELTAGYVEDPSKILSKCFNEPYDEMVIVRDIAFWSLCEHHLLPFHGSATVAYVPKGKVVGLSKIPRLVQAFARRLQVQERLTQQIAKAMEEHLNPEGVGVVIRGTHTCMAMRGVKSEGSMVTSCLLGCFREDPRARAEFMNFTANGDRR
jgi:GTP cyclohydrolase I